MTDSDRELLELAAKAVGITLEWDAGRCFRFHPDGLEPLDPFKDEWNPLTDDGDALRLAVKGLNWPYGGRAFDDTVTAMYAVGQLPADPYAATRRAIVRAAAEIGKAIK